MPVRANPRFGVWVLALLFGLGLIVTQPSPGRADAPFGAVDARATADALRVGVAVKKFLIVENFVDAGGPTAQAHLTSVGSDAFAALPDPGGLVIGYNTFVGLATGSGLPFNYPLYAAAQYPGSPAAETADPAGAYAVSAKTAPDGAEALARMRPTAGDAVVSGAVAQSAVKLDGRVLTATSETHADAVSLAKGAVTLSGVASRSVTTRTAGRAEPTTETSLNVDLITVGDKRIRYGAGGFEFLGTPVPVPSDTVATALVEALKPLGLTIDVSRPVAVAGGMKASVLEIRQASPLPAGQSDLVLRFGGATSSVAAEDASPVSAGPGSLPPGGGGIGSSDGSASGAGASTGSAGDGSGGTDGSGGSSPGPASEAGAGSAGSFGLSGDGAGSSASSGSGSLFGSGTASGSGALPGTGSPSGAGAASPGGSASIGSAAGTRLQSAAPARLASHHRSVAGPYGALVAGGLAIVALSAIWARRSAAAALWVNQ